MIYSLLLLKKWDKAVTAGNVIDIRNDLKNFLLKRSITPEK